MDEFGNSHKKCSDMDPWSPSVRSEGWAVRTLTQISQIVPEHLNEKAAVLTPSPSLTF